LPEGKINFIHVDSKIVVRHPITSELAQSVKLGRANKSTTAVGGKIVFGD
jgi:hypothetical protein